MKFGNLNFLEPSGPLQDCFMMVHKLTQLICRPGYGLEDEEMDFDSRQGHEFFFSSKGSMKSLGLTKPAM